MAHFTIDLLLHNFSGGNDDKLKLCLKKQKTDIFFTAFIRFVDLLLCIAVSSMHFVICHLNKIVLKVKVLSVHLQWVFCRFKLIIRETYYVVHERPIAPRTCAVCQKTKSKFSLRLRYKLRTRILNRSIYF